jgi:hypothetical protein
MSEAENKLAMAINKAYATLSPDDHELIDHIRQSAMAVVGENASEFNELARTRFDLA